MKLLFCIIIFSRRESVWKQAILLPAFLYETKNNALQYLKGSFMSPENDRPEN